MSRAVAGYPNAKVKKVLDDLRIYAITDRTGAPESKFLEFIEKALSGGVRALQLREKDLTPREALALAKRVQPLTAKYGARLFINDRADIAKMAGADGVHLTETSVSAKEVRESFPDLAVGVSTHSLEGAVKAEHDGADFITFGPVFETPSKKKYGPPQGLERLGDICGRVKIPVLALGGVNISNVSTVLERGAFGIAMVSGIWSAQDIEKRILEYRESLKIQS